jgi:hypothetical protein
MKATIRAIIGLMVGAAALNAAAQKMSRADQIDIPRITRDFAVGKLDEPAWDKADVVVVATYWSGEAVPEGRRFTARLLWSDAALYVRFDAEQSEPFVISETPVLNRKTLNLWDRDVCEIFVAPDASRPHKYFEFEVAPTGEWVDLRIEVKPKNRLTDTDYDSRLETAARQALKKVTMALRIPWGAFGKTPSAGDVWLGNLFRCVGRDPGRGYLAWRPTRSEKPNFHVPEVFGRFVFRS